MPTIAASKSSPPRCESPVDVNTSKVFSLISRSETSNVPPPKSYTATISSSWLERPNPYAIAAAVGSLIRRNTSNPAIPAASIVACRWMSSK